jgi:phage shock protein PspC (stress-responsive transcriptional regulator)
MTINFDWSSFTVFVQAIVFYCALTSLGGNLKLLKRSYSDTVLGGVCGGCAANTNTPAWLWRVAFCLTGAALIYLLLWIFVPRAV